VAGHRHLLDYFFLFVKIGEKAVRVAENSYIAGVLLAFSLLLKIISFPFCIVRFFPKRILESRRIGSLCWGLALPFCQDLSWQELERWITTRKVMNSCSRSL
jgi:hypothetical protein